MIRTWPVQQSLYGLLAADTTFMGLITALLDEPDENQRFPYVTIGEATASGEDLLIETGATQTLMLHFWDRDAPISRLKQIMDRAYQAIHWKQPAVTGAQIVSCFVEFVEVIRDVDTLHGIMRVRIQTFG